MARKNGGRRSDREIFALALPALTLSSPALDPGGFGAWVFTNASMLVRPLTGGMRSRLRPTAVAGF